MGVIGWSCQCWAARQRCEAASSMVGRAVQAAAPCPMPQFPLSPPTRARQHRRLRSVLHAGLDVPGNRGDPRSGTAWSGNPKTGSEPPPAMSLGDGIQPRGMRSCLCRGLATGTPLSPPA